jgi:ribonucleoside-diphosphate reductase alpha chain
MTATEASVRAIGIRRHFTTEDLHPYDTLEWERRDSRIPNHKDGGDVFLQEGVEFPQSWSLNATNIAAQKYFRGSPGSEAREWSLRQLIDRVADTITRWGQTDGYFEDDVEAETFRAELKYLLVHQRAAFNSPVWFNIGVKGVPQQASACFILSVEDTMSSIRKWWHDEGTIFIGGSGAGINVSPLRASHELIRGSANTSSGPISFMQGADAQANVIKSGGKTRRAAKMVILDADHPDIFEYAVLKAKAERLARAGKTEGLDMDIDGPEYGWVPFQNANNSVRVTEEFMRAVEDDGDWPLYNRVLAADGSKVVAKMVKARDLMGVIAQAAWECADPGMQFDTTINRWNTAAATGRINGSNPCSEYMHLDNSACNLASINLLKFLEDNGSFDVAGFKHAVEVIFTAQEILVGNADYPTEEIAQTSRDFRQLGLGYANLGALLMAQGLPYDSDAGRAWAGAITAILTGHAYVTSAKTAARMGPFAGYEKNREPMLKVLKQHRQATYETIDAELLPKDLVEEARQAWEDACNLATDYGVRNSQASVLAPTGTIGLMMDCDTTGIEPDLALTKAKKLVGGGTMLIVNQTIPRALRKLGYSQDQIGEAVKNGEETIRSSGILGYIDQHKTIIGAPGFNPEHLPVFACSMGDNVIDYMGHVRMMAAAQPYISGAISKTVNMPEDVGVEDVWNIYLESWRLGLKAVAIYRDNCKVTQPLATQKSEAIKAEVERVVETVIVQEPVRQKLPKKRQSNTFSFRVADCHGYVIVGEYPDGRPGEIFLNVAKGGSTLAGIMDAFAISVSHGLQYGVPLEAFVKMFTNVKFEPAGMTDDTDIRFATSLVDYVFRRLAVDYMPREKREELGVLTIDERLQPTLPGTEIPATTMEREGGYTPDPKVPVVEQTHSAPSVQGIGRRSTTVQKELVLCHVCGDIMVRAGSCYACPSCGSTSGCS